MSRAPRTILLIASAAGCLYLGPAFPAAAGTRLSLTPRPHAPIRHPRLRDFTLMVLPDTQYYTQQPDDPDNPYYLQAQWIVDNQQALNIPMVLHMGDVTHTNVTSEWLIADAAHTILENAGVPYSIVPGNHDYPRENGGLERDTGLYNTFFGPGRFAGEPWYGGSFGSTNDSNCILFEVGPMRFMVVNLEFAPRKEALCWANEVIGAHPDRRVIVVTHCYQERGGGHRLDCADYYDIDGGNGDVVWDEVASRHSNVFMVLSGHVGDSERFVRVSQPGEEVIEVLTDYQFEVPCATPPCESSCDISGSNLGNGWLRALHFEPRNNRIVVQTFSVSDGNIDYFPDGDPVLFCTDYDADPLADDHAYELSYDMSTPMPPYTYEDGGGFAFHDRTVNSTGAGQQKEPSVAVTDSGNSVVVWQDDQDNNGYYEILARGFEADGSERFGDFTVNSDAGGQQYHPSVAVDDAGGFVVVWEDDKDDNGYFQIYARGFEADGSERFADFTVNAEAEGQQYRPAVGITSGGSFVAAFEDDQDKDGNFDVRCRGFDSDGAELFSDRLVNTRFDGEHRAPTIAVDTTGRFVIAWEDDNDNNGLWQIWARGFDAAGEERISAFNVNYDDEGQQLEPAIGMSGSSDFVVAWQDDRDANGYYEIAARGVGSGGP